MSRERYAGVMSGTSLDGVDAVVADFAPASGRACETLGAAFLPFPEALRDELAALQASGADELARAADASVALADLYAGAIRAACADARMDVAALSAAGVHGQTVRHRPERGWTIQLNDAARVAERTGVAVVADFRRRDIAAGGEGAPLVPAFHAALFSDPRVHRVVVNIGGIANLTDLPPGGVVRGFDTGPGNLLSDLWHAQHRGGPYDAEGAWAASGQPVPSLLEAMLADPFFSLVPPKSTGRDRFHSSWLDEHLARSGGNAAPPDVQATLVALTARTIGRAIRAHASASTEVLVCGGGARNATLMRALVQELAPRRVAPTSDLGVAVGHVEALAFAWLARETLAGRPGNLPAVTGAKGARVLGAVHHA
ncbi:MAG: anhydro-N-acetylmuramic acid kinase [Burkholderiales bacterium]|nr:anhydro-N-acetylmuramic acid kinase [Burkholderiales bacterium]